MTDDHSRASFTKLNDSNYGTWAVMMEALLTSKELFTDIVEIKVDVEDAAGQARPQSDIDAEMTKKLTKRSKTKMAQARAEMILRVEPGQLAHMRAKDPLDMWQDLHNVHRARGFAASLALRKKFLTMRMGRQQSMTSWIGEVKEQAFNMQEAGTAVSEDDQILALTGGLPAAYNTTIATLDALAPSARTLDLVITTLLSAEAVVGRSVPRSANPTETDHGVALAVQSATRCYICDETGHMKRDCPYRHAIDELKKKKSTSNSAHVAISEDSDIEW